jgi:ssDNA-binding Zn-finger/Zn-ribbon topoisomerase 1
MAQGVEPKAAWQMAAREADQVHGRGAYASVKEAAPVYQNTPMNPNQMMMGPQQMAMPGTHQNPVGPGGMSVTGKCVACGGVTNADGSCPQCGAGAGVNQQGNLAHPGGTAGQQTTPLGIMPSPYAKTAGDEYDNWYAQQGLPEGGSASMVRECPNCHGHNMQYQAPSGPDLHLDLEQGTLNGHPPLDDTPRNTPGPLHNPDATDDMGHFACPDCGYKLNGEGAESDNLVHHNMREQDWGAHLPIRQGADHQGPITPQQKEVFAEFLIDQGRNDEVAAMMGNPGLYADEWAQYLNRSTQPPEVDPAEQAPVPQMDPSQMGQMPMPGMTAPPPGQGQMMAKVAGMGPEWHGFQHPQNPGLVYDHNVGDFVAKHSLSELYDATEPVDPPPIPGPNGQLMRYQWDQHGKGSYGRTAESSRRCPKCTSATTSIMNADGDMRCHRCGNVWDMDVVEDHPTIKSNWQIKRAFQDNLNDAPNPVAAPAADVQAPGDREQQADSTLTWQSSDGQPLQVGQVYEMHNPNYPIPDVIKVQAVKPDAITVTMEGEYNAPSDPQDANGPGYTHEIDRSELETQGLFFNPVQVDGSEEQSQDQTQQDGIGQTVNTEPVEQPHDSFPVHTHVEQPTDHCPKCSYNHVTSSYTSPETIRYECYRCANTWEIEDKDPGTEAGVDLSWLKEDDSPGGDIGFDPRALAMASNGKSRNIQDIARDPRAAAMRQKADAAKAERLRLAGAKFSPSEQKQFIDEDGVARNSDLLNLEGTHYVSAFDNSKARPDRVNDNYLGLGL